MCAKWTETQLATSRLAEIKVAREAEIQGLKEVLYILASDSVPACVLIKTQLTGAPFNDAYCYRDWLWTVPLILKKILWVTNLPEVEYTCRAWTLGFCAALMICSEHYGRH